MLEFAEFLEDFVRDLNDLSEEGAAVLVEGKRDVRALTDLGYTGKIYTVAAVSRTGTEALVKAHPRMIILTDLDTEGRKLAARYMKFFRPLGIKASLSERKRLSAASKGVFLHIENLHRFARKGEFGAAQP